MRSENLDEFADNIHSEMRAVTLNGAGWDHLSVRSVPVPKPNENEILARVDCAGICTSLLKLIDQGPKHPLMYGRDLQRYPAILGDEGSLTLVKIGEALRGEYQVGERFVLQPAVDHAPIRNLDRYDNNGKGVNKVAAGYTLPGHLAEYMLITEEELAAGCLLRLPDQAMSFAHAAITEPISCCVSAQDHHVHLSHVGPAEPRLVEKGIKKDGVMIVVGAGAMGRMHVDVGLSSKARSIIVSDFIDERLEIVERLFSARAKRLGIILRTVNSGREDLNQIVAELTNDSGASDVIVAVGAVPAIESSQRLVGKGGVLNLFGGLPRGKEFVSFDTLAVHYLEVNITGSSGGYSWDMIRTLELMSKGSIEPSSHITCIGDLEHAPDLLKIVKNREIDGKAVVYPHRRLKDIMSVGMWTAEDERSYLAKNEE